MNFKTSFFTAPLALAINLRQKQQKLMHILKKLMILTAKENGKEIILLSMILEIKRHIEIHLMW